MLPHSADRETSSPATPRTGMLATMISALVQELGGWVERLPPPQERMAALTAALRAEFGDRDEPVTAAAVTAIEATAQRYCRHLQLHFHPDGHLVVDRTAPGWPADDPSEIRRYAWPISSVRRTDDGMAIVAVDSMPAFAASEPFIRAAITLAQDARGVVLDLRHNGGGDPETVATIVGWLCGPGLDLSDVVYRERTRHWTTPVGPVLPAETPVVILTSARSYSSGEALAYHLQARRRGPVVGQNTPGAADHVTPVNVTPQVQAILPEAYVIDSVSGSNWEGTGVRPDIETGEGDTEATALTVLRDTAG
jgi:peptidase S41-like protein